MWETWAGCGSLLQPGLQNQGRAAPGSGKPQLLSSNEQCLGSLCLEASETTGKKGMCVCYSATRAKKIPVCSWNTVLLLQALKILSGYVLPIFPPNGDNGAGCQALRFTQISFTGGENSSLLPLLHYDSAWSYTGIKPHCHSLQLGTLHYHSPRQNIEVQCFQISWWLNWQEMLYFWNADSLEESLQLFKWLLESMKLYIWFICIYSSWQR